MSNVNRLIQSEKGTALLEYTLTVGLIAVVALLSVAFVGGNVRDTLKVSGSGMYDAPGANGSGPGNDPSGPGPGDNK